MCCSSISSSFPPVQMDGGVVVRYYLEDWYTLDIQNFYKLKWLLWWVGSPFWDTTWCAGVWTGEAQLISLFCQPGSPLPDSAGLGSQASSSQAHRQGHTQLHRETEIRSGQIQTQGLASTLTTPFKGHKPKGFMKFAPSLSVEGDMHNFLPSQLEITYIGLYYKQAIRFL